MQLNSHPHWAIYKDVLKSPANRWQGKRWSYPTANACVLWDLATSCENLSSAAQLTKINLMMFSIGEVLGISR